MGFLREKKIGIRCGDVSFLWLMSGSSKMEDMGGWDGDGDGNVILAAEIRARDEGW